MDHFQADVNIATYLARQWAVIRDWAEDLLCDALHLSHPRDVLSPQNRGRHPIPNTPWHYSTHGAGVDIHLDGEVGGIDFDFDQRSPDLSRLRLFADRQLNTGRIPPGTSTAALVEDPRRFDRAAHVALDKFPEYRRPDRATSSAMRAAVRSERPSENLKELVLSWKQAGLGRSTVEERLTALLLELQGVGTEPEEDIVMDLLDLVVGYCRPEARLFP